MRLALLCFALLYCAVLCCAALRCCWAAGARGGRACVAGRQGRRPRVVTRRATVGATVARAAACVSSTHPHTPPPSLPRLLVQAARELVLPVGRFATKFKLQLGMFSTVQLALIIWQTLSGAQVRWEGPGGGEPGNLAFEGGRRLQQATSSQLLPPLFRCRCMPVGHLRTSPPPAGSPADLPPLRPHPPPLPRAVGAGQPILPGHLHLHLRRHHHARSLPDLQLHGHAVSVALCSSIMASQKSAPVAVAVIRWVGL